MRRIDAQNSAEIPIVACSLVDNLEQSYVRSNDLMGNCDAAGLQIGHLNSCVCVIEFQEMQVVCSLLALGKTGKLANPTNASQLAAGIVVFDLLSSVGLIAR